MTDAVIAQLESAEQAALSYSSASGPADPVVPCPLLAQKEVVLAHVVGLDAAPLAGIAVALRDSTGQLMRSKTGTDGIARFTALTAGAFELGLYELDKDAWELVGAQPIGDTAPGVPAWEAGADMPVAPGFTHAVIDGECVSKLAVRFGFSADTVWNSPDNAALKAKRKDMNILAPGDALVIPARRIQWIAAATANRYELRQKGGAQTLNIRFLFGTRARANLDFLLKIVCDDGAIMADQAGKTDAGGFVKATVPPGTTSAEITLLDGQLREVHSFAIGAVGPIDTLKGVQARLRNLGYDCADEDGALGALTGAALRAFQQDQQLAVSGQLDDTTRTALRQAFLS